MMPRLPARRQVSSTQSHNLRAIHKRLRQWSSTQAHHDDADAGAAARLQRGGALAAGRVVHRQQAQKNQTLLIAGGQRAGGLRGGAFRSTVTDLRVDLQGFGLLAGQGNTRPSSWLADSEPVARNCGNMR